MICSRLPIAPKTQWICSRERTHSNDIHSILSSHGEALDWAIFLTSLLGKRWTVTKLTKRMAAFLMSRAKRRTTVLTDLPKDMMRLIFGIKYLSLPSAMRRQNPLCRPHHFIREQRSTSCRRSEHFPPEL